MRNESPPPRRKRSGRSSRSSSVARELTGEATIAWSHLNLDRRDAKNLEKTLVTRFRSRILFHLHSIPPAIFWSNGNHGNPNVFALAHNGRPLHIAMVGTYNKNLSTWPGFHDKSDGCLVISAINLTQARHARELKHPHRSRDLDESLSVDFLCPHTRENFAQPYPVYERPLAALDTLIYDLPLSYVALNPGDLLQVDFIVRTDTVNTPGVLVALRVARLNPRPPKTTRRARSLAAAEFEHDEMIEYCNRMEI